MASDNVSGTGDETPDIDSKDVFTYGDDIDTSDILSSLPDVGTHIPLVDGAVRPDFLLPTGFDLPLTETAQLSLDLSHVDGSMGWLDTVYQLPLDNPWWDAMNIQQPLIPSNDEASQQDSQLGIPTGGQPQGVDAEQGRRQRKNDSNKAYRARKKQERLTGVKVQRLLKRDDPVHQAMMKARKKEQDRQRWANSRLAAAKKSRDDAADLAEAETDTDEGEDEEDEVGEK